MSKPQNTRHSMRIPSVKRSANEALSPPSSPKQKKSDIDVPKLREQMLSWQQRHIKCFRERRNEYAAELFFLTGDKDDLPSMMDYGSWRAKPVSDALSAFLEVYNPDRQEQNAAALLAAASSVSSPKKSSVATAVLPESTSPVPRPGSGGSTGALKLIISRAGSSQGTAHVVESVRASVSSPAAEEKPSLPVPEEPELVVESMDVQETVPVAPEPVEVPLAAEEPAAVSVKLEPEEAVAVSCAVTTVAEISLPSQSPTTVAATSSSPQPSQLETHGKKSAKPTSPIKSPVTGKLSASPKKAQQAAVQTKEEIAERAKQEAWVTSRIAELRKDGLWTPKKLPKCIDPPRAKTHWDYLLEEMRWLAADFENERKWKKAAAKKVSEKFQEGKIASVAARKGRESEMKEERAEMEREKEGKRIAAFIAKEVRQFWSGVEKVVDYKRQALIDEHKKKALDHHLSFIVGQTEKYTSWLQEGLSGRPPQAQTSITATPSTSKGASVTSEVADDTEFAGDDEESEDDETTIAKAEKAISKEEVESEVAALTKEADVELDDFLDSLPPGYLEDYGKPLETEKNASEKTSEVDEEEDEEEISDEESSAESSRESDAQSSSSETDEQMESEDESEAEPMHTSASLKDLLQEAAAMDQPLTSGEGSGTPAAAKQAGATSSLNDEIDFAKLQSEDSEERQQELAHIAEAAERFQPKGYTLETTSVVTKVPFLLKHKLREYQHVGLDWLVTLYDKKLNGILADEMGLGKTIQTIALLAHLACDKGVWGPHLVVVPTTLMLNWEMEFKKWCPSFKIVTYYGSPKERKEKRTGWTKPNAFHVCITSYKLVLQDHSSFRRMRWKYLILDEAQHIKNFKSQRWQLLLNFNTQRRLLLTGTPLQNNLIELWSLMHFLMPHVFQSHRDFKDWFANPLSGMIEGTQEYNENLIRRLHKILRPFLLRRLKSEVEKQLPKKYEHIVMCPLSKRQRYLYDDFMSRGTTREGLESGSVMSVLNILMQLRKVCNHPNLFEPRPIISPFAMHGITHHTASLVDNAIKKNPIEDIRLVTESRADNETEGRLTCVLRREIAADKKFIQEMDASGEDVPPKSPDAKGFQFRPLRQPQQLPLDLERQKPGMSDSGVDRITGAKVERKIEFVIPSTVAQALNLAFPVMISLNSSNGQQLVPVMLQPPELLSRKLDDNMPPPEQLPVLRLVPSVHAGRPPVVQPAGFTANPSAASRSLNVASSASGGVGAAPALPTSSSGSTNLTRLPDASPRLGEIVSFGSNGSSTTTNVIASKTVLYRTTAEANAISAKLVQESKERDAESRRALTNHASSSSDAVPNTMTEETQLSSSSRKRPYVPPPGVVPVKHRRYEWHQSNLERLWLENERRFQLEPTFGSDLREAVSVFRDREESFQGASVKLGLSSLKTPRVGPGGEELAPLVMSSMDRFTELQSQVLKRFLVYAAKVKSSPPAFHVSHPDVSVHQFRQSMEPIFQNELSALLEPFHDVATAQSIQFPEARLIAYDCGKLQEMSGLLVRLHAEGHRCLIFTQMSKMLDILEAFLCFHGFKYLRLDGSTRIEQRQVLMERFNQDARIFCFILSTRSGGLGVNLTGADTVIFYDSDWNPTMDAQAQDRCHRIGQTRDVHIYRLISEQTVEQNILKKAQQKRLLGEIAIEEGAFTADFFKNQNIRDLFDVQDGLTAVSAESTPAAALSAQELEQMLTRVEDERDVEAATAAKAEATLELAEFDESKPMEEAATEKVESKAEREIRQLVEQLSPIEHFALKTLESIIQPLDLNELKWTDEAIQQQKKEWELTHLQHLKEEEERMQEEQEDELLLTYSAEDARSQFFSLTDPSDVMQIWQPPTPPLDDSEFDPYVEPSLGYLYEWDPLSESQLPPIHIEKFSAATRRDTPQDLAAARIEQLVSELSSQSAPSPAVTPPYLRGSDSQAIIASIDTAYRKALGEASGFPLVRSASPHGGGLLQPRQPRSLFECVAPAGAYNPATARYRREQQHQHPASKGGRLAAVIGPYSRTASPTLAEAAEALEGPDWTIHEDWILLQALQKYQQITPTSSNTAHTPNWEFIASRVNCFSFVHRSPEQCRLNYKHSILTQEEGRSLAQMDPRIRKLGLTTAELALYKKGRNRTQQLFQEDNGATILASISQHFSALAGAASKRPAAKPRRHPQQQQRATTGASTSVPTGSDSLLLTEKNQQVLASFGVSVNAYMDPIKASELKEQRNKERPKEMLPQQQSPFAQQASSTMSGGQPTAILSRPITPQMQQSVPQQHLRFIQNLSQQNSMQARAAGVGAASLPLGAQYISQQQRIISPSATNTTGLVAISAGHQMQQPGVRGAMSGVATFVQPRQLSQQQPASGSVHLQHVSQQQVSGPVAMQQPFAIFRQSQPQVAMRPMQRNVQPQQQTTATVGVLSTSSGISHVSQLQPEMLQQIRLRMQIQAQQQQQQQDQSAQLRAMQQQEAQAKAVNSNLMNTVIYSGTGMVISGQQTQFVPTSVPPSSLTNPNFPQNAALSSQSSSVRMPSVTLPPATSASDRPPT